MSRDSVLEIGAKFAPYNDGSGHQVSVSVQQEKAADPVTITIDGWQFDAKHWPEIRAGVDRFLLAAAPPQPGAGSSE